MRSVWFGGCEPEDQKRIPKDEDLIIKVERTDGFSVNVKYK